MTGVTPQRLYLLRLGNVSIPISTGMLEMVLGCYLIQMSDGTNVLVDTGLPADFAPPDVPQDENATNVIDQLAALGLRPDDIDVLICTHFDADHSGRNDSFQKAEHVVQRRHY